MEELDRERLAHLCRPAPFPLGRGRGLVKPEADALRMRVEPGNRAPERQGLVMVESQPLGDYRRPQSEHRPPLG
jgi:hypothetical protein